MTLKQLNLVCTKSALYTKNAHCIKSAHCTQCAPCTQSAPWTQSVLNTKRSSGNHKMSYWNSDSVLDSIPDSVPDSIPDSVPDSIPVSKAIPHFRLNSHLKEYLHFSKVQFELKVRTKKKYFLQKVHFALKVLFAQILYLGLKCKLQVQKLELCTMSAKKKSKYSKQALD